MLTGKTKLYALFSKNGFKKELKDYAKKDKNIVLYDLKKIKEKLLKNK